jgi:hypothetical protein
MLKNSKVIQIGEDIMVESEVVGESEVVEKCLLES